jgi:hypothetical protein
METTAVNVASLQKAAQTYDKDFKAMPHLVLLPELMALRIRLLNVPNKHTIIEQLRKGGITRPYEKGGDIGYSSIGELKERSLQTETSFAAIKDNIKNYKEVDVLFDPTKSQNDNQTKKHPLEMMIIKNQIITVGEDILDALFPAERNVADKTPMGMFNGFDTIIDNAIASGEISLEQKNLINSGAITAPASETDTSAWDALLAWLRKASAKFSIGQVCVLRIPIRKYSYCSDALANKLRYKDVEFADFVRHLQDKANLPKLIVVRHYVFGDGDRITLQVDGNLDLGMNVIGDEQFVQVRNPWEDPNLVQYWLQFDAGARINSLHPYKFITNEGVPVAMAMSGDYIDSASGSIGVGV